MSSKTPPPLNPANPDTLAAVPDHSHQPRDPNHELFGVVPQNIGTILSADSTLKRGQDGWSAPARGALAAVVAAGVISLMTYGIRHVEFGTAITICIVGLGFGSLAVFLSWAIMRLVAEDGYVGTEGLYQAKIFGSRKTPLVEKNLRFADATELHVSQTRNSTNGVYSNTTYSYTWNDAGAKRIFAITGAYRCDNKLPPTGDPYHFARAAEVAWSNRCLDGALRQLQSEGSILFRIDKTRAVRVGAGFMEFRFGGEPHRVTPGDIGTVRLDQGQFTFKHKDAKWYSSDGKFNFAYSSMPNAKVFLLALDKLMGYRWG